MTERSPQDSTISLDPMPSNIEGMEESLRSSVDTLDTTEEGNRRDSVSIDDLGAESNEYHLEFSGSDGAIKLLHKPGTPQHVFSVESSTDSRISAGDDIVVDGSTVSGGSATMGLIEKDRRLAFRRQRIMPVQVGGIKTDSVQYASPEDFEALRKIGKAFVDDAGNTFITFTSPNPRGSGFMSSLRVKTVTEDGVQERDVF